MSDGDEKGLGGAGAGRLFLSSWYDGALGAGRFLAGCTGSGTWNI
jgi:hypothetical protein